MFGTRTARFAGAVLLAMTVAGCGRQSPEDSQLVGAPPTTPDEQPVASASTISIPSTAPATTTTLGPAPQWFKDYGPPISMVPTRLPAVDHPAIPPEEYAASLAKAFGASDKVVKVEGGDGAPYGVPGYWLRFTVSVASTNTQDLMFAQWEARVIAADTAEAFTSSVSLAAAVGGTALIYQLPDGSQVKGRADVLGNLASRQAFGTQADGTSFVPDQTAITAAFEPLGLQVSSIDTIRLAEDVLFVHLATADASKLAVSVADIQNALFGGSPPQVEATYITVTDKATGEQCAVFASANRAGTGSTWAKPELQKQFSIRQPGESS